MLPELLDKAPFILAEAAIAERLRRMPEITLHPSLFNTPLIYQPAAAKLMAGLYRQYRDIAAEASIPIFHTAPTWRLDQERIAAAGVPRSINADAVQYLRTLQRSWQLEESPIVVGALLGPRNDCYRPEEALSTEEARKFHAWQADELAAAGAEFLLAQTMPSVREATGIAQAMAATGLPYFVSFVIDRQGRVLDGNPLPDAVEKIDAALERPPSGYLVNCTFPTFLCASEQPAALFQRLIGLQANASSKDLSELDGADELAQDSITDWAGAMAELHQDYGLKILGGCCGTDDQFLRALVSRCLTGQGD